VKILPVGEPNALSPIAVRIITMLPLSWRSSALRRRFLFLGLLTPGFTAIASLPQHRSFWLLILGTLVVLGAGALRSLSEPHILSGGLND
jgi:hypothetical protein